MNSSNKHTQGKRMFISSGDAIAETMKRYVRYLAHHRDRSLLYRADVIRLQQRIYNMQNQIEDLEHEYYIITPEGDWYGPECTEAAIRRCSESDFADTRHTIVLVIDKVDAREEE